MAIDTERKFIITALVSQAAEKIKPFLVGADNEQILQLIHDKVHALAIISSKSEEEVTDDLHILEMISAAAVELAAVAYLWLDLSPIPTEMFKSAQMEVQSLS